MAIDLSKKLHDSIMNILIHHFSGYPIYAFGSRVTGKAKRYSDLDLVIKGDDKIPLSQLAQAEIAFSESNIPFKIDLIDWHRISPEFQAIIMSEAILFKK